MQIIRKSSFSANPWRNGGGVTHEAIRVPRAGEAFRWRVSVAQIEASGPFSDFADYDRKMVLLRGSGVRLTMGEDPPVELRNVGDLVEFDGAVSTYCELLDGPCADLNLMVSKSLSGVRAWVQPLQHPFRPGPDHPITLVFGISGALVLDGSPGERTSLDPWDMVVLSTDDGAVSLSPAEPGHGAPPLVFLATLDDNSA
jgi:environmental stress-induced protein Ves